MLKHTRTALRRNILTAIIMLAGAAIMLYPVMATQWNNGRQHEFARQYNRQASSLAVESREKTLAQAHAYNKTLTGVPILDPWLLDVRKDPQSRQYETYTGQLSQTTAMARIRVPRVGIDLPTYHGTTEPVLAKGAGHLYGTSLPVGGAGTHAVLTTHTAFPQATLFDHLIDVKQGDLMFVDVYGQTLAYRVNNIKVVLPTEVNDLVTTPGKDQLTLFTCTPYAVNTHRLLVTGQRVNYDKQTDKKQTAAYDGGLENWMLWLLAASGATIATLIILLLAGHKKAPSQHKN